MYYKHTLSLSLSMNGDVLQKGTEREEKRREARADEERLVDWCGRDEGSVRLEETQTTERTGRTQLVPVTLRMAGQCVCTGCLPGRTESRCGRKRGYYFDLNFRKMGEFLIKKNFRLVKFQKIEILQNL